MSVSAFVCNHRVDADAVVARAQSHVPPVGRSIECITAAASQLTKVVSRTPPRVVGKKPSMSVCARFSNPALFVVTFIEADGMVSNQILRGTA